MSRIDENLNALIERAVGDQQLIASAAQNIRSLLGSGSSALYEQVVSELVRAGAWNELNDRFYKTLAFGTGGLRGRTIGKIVTAAERGTPRADEPPEFPCVGTNAMNFYNISRATQGLVAYLQEWFATERISGRRRSSSRTTRGISRETLPSSRQSRGGEWLRRLRLRRTALDAGTFVRRSLSARERRHRHHRQPQSAARQRLQSLLRRRRASGRAARQRHHREGECDQERNLRAGSAERAGQIISARSRNRRSLHGAARDARCSIRELVRSAKSLRIVFTRRSTAPAASSSSRC